MYIYTHICVYICVYVYTYVYMCIYVCIYARIYTCNDTLFCMYIYIYIILYLFIYLITFPALSSELGVDFWPKGQRGGLFRAWQLPSKPKALFWVAVNELIKLSYHNSKTILFTIDA